MTVAPIPAAPPLTLDSVEFVGTRLARPECVLCTRRGDVYASDRRGGVSHLAPDGTHRLYAGATLDLLHPLHPNGIALDRDGSFLVAQLVDDEGGVLRLHRDGRLVPVLREVDGETLSVTNFVLLDSLGRLWVSVSTRRRPRTDAFRPDVADGYLVLMDARGARIVADGLGFANECRLDATGAWLYVNETYARRVVRFPVAADGSLGRRDVVAVLEPGDFPDGMAFDADGGLWITCIVSNRLLRIGPDAVPRVMLEDRDDAHVAAVDAAYRAGTLTRALLDHRSWRVLAHPSSIAFCGPDLDHAVLGVLLDHRLPRLRMPVRGLAPTHWEYE